MFTTNEKKSNRKEKLSRNKKDIWRKSRFNKWNSKRLIRRKDLYSEQGLLDSINTIEGLQQLKDRLMSAKKSQDAIMDKPKEEITIPEAVLDKMITPPENSIENTVAKVAMRK